MEAGKIIEVKRSEPVKTLFENGTYFIPSTYNDKPILAIEDYAFMSVDASQIVIFHVDVQFPSTKSCDATTCT
mgnify:CR=1 FL=1